MHSKPLKPSREDILIQKYRDVGIMPGGELLLHHSDAIRFIEDCQALGLVILGMDFYIVENGRTREINSADWEGINKGPGALERTIDASYRLIRDGLPDGADWVSFVVDEQTIE
jgi:hypothetical protein